MRRTAALERSLSETSAREDALSEDTELIRQAMAYVIEVYRELAEENGAPTLGTQNQAVDFILADPELRDAAVRWARAGDSGEASTRPRRRPPCDDAYRRIAAHLRRAMAPPVFQRLRQGSG